MSVNPTQSMLTSTETGDHACRTVVLSKKGWPLEVWNHTYLVIPVPANSVDHVLGADQELLH